MIRSVQDRRDGGEEEEEDQKSPSNPFPLMITIAPAAAVQYIYLYFGRPVTLITSQKKSQVYKQCIEMSINGK